MKFKWQWCLFLIACPQLLAAGNRFIVFTGINVSDIMVTHFPNLLFIQRSLLEGTGIPLWSPLIFSGYPFAANPLSTLWYPPGWLALLFPLPLGINLVMALHVIIGCAGMAYLLRNLSIKEPLTWFGAILYGLLPVGFARCVGGHYTWVCASAWLPWVLAFPISQNVASVKKAVLSAAALGLMMLADLRFAAYGVIIWFLLNIFLAISEKRMGILTNLRKLGWTGLSLVFALGISAVVWLPLMEYSALSTRTQLTSNDTFFLSLPILQALGVLVPGHPPTIEWVNYLGVGIMVPCFYSFSLLRKERYLIFWWLVAVLCLFWSFGEAVPVNHWLASLPGLDLLRVPARGMFFSSISLLIICVISLNNLLNGKIERIKSFRLSVSGILVFSVMLQIGVYLANPVTNISLIGHIFFSIAISAGFLLYSYQVQKTSVFAVIYMVLIISDLSLANWGLTGYRSLTDVLSDGAEETQYLVSRVGDFRVFSPSYSIPQHTAANLGLQLVDGIDPLQLISYDNFVNNAAGLPNSGYSVALPAFATGNPSIDNTAIQPDAVSFGLLNTRYLVSAFPIETTGWVLEKKTENNYIYSNQAARGWAWIETSEPESTAGYSSVQRIIRMNNEITISAEGPGNLVLSEVNYPGWQTTVDNFPEKIDTAHSILRSVAIPAGEHTIHFKFVPYFVYTGAGISLLSILVCLIFLRKSPENDR